ncbi:MAG: class I SAM-dependent methyltransferase [Streptosporangiaceae bacterium]
MIARARETYLPPSSTSGWSGRWRLAHRMAAGGVQVVQSDATCLPYGSGRFSAVLSFTMLHHLPSTALRDRLFAEAARVLRPDGVFAGTDSLDSEESGNCTPATSACRSNQPAWPAGCRRRGSARWRSRPTSTAFASGPGLPPPPLAEAIVQLTT